MTYVSPITQQRGPGFFIVSEANGTLSRDLITIASGAGVLQQGVVLGKITASGKYIPCVVTASDGSQNAVAILYGAVDATSADAPAVGMTRLCEVYGGELTYSDSDSGHIATQNASLLTQDIKVMPVPVTSF